MTLTAMSARTFLTWGPMSASLLWLLSGCSGESIPETPPVAEPVATAATEDAAAVSTTRSGSRVELNLPVHWKAGAPPTGTLDFVLDAPRPARLYMDGLWWGVDVLIDGKEIPRVFMGHAPQEIDLPPLAAGPHHLELRLFMPTVEPKGLTMANRNWQVRAGLVELRLVGSSRVGSIALDYRDGQLSPKVDVVGATEGSTVDLVVLQDGRPLQRWEPIGAGQSFDAMKWKGKLWDIGKAELYTATATLRDSGGAVIDTRSQRIGVRQTEVRDGAFFINGQNSPLMALRVNPLETPTFLVDSLPEVEANAVEVHGEVADSQWLATFDEWAVPVVHMPRCDGGIWEGRPDYGAMWRGIAPMASEQDRRLLEISTARPSVLAWICEGSPNFRMDACGRLREDPLHRPVLGIDGGAVSIAGVEARNFNLRAWVIEIGSAEHFLSFASSGEAFLKATGKGGPGGVFFPPPPRDRASWIPAWKAVSQELGTRAWTAASRRATSVLKVRGAKPGSAVWLELPGMSARGAIADNRGLARIELWYAGEATLKAGNESRTVTLVPDMWEGTRRVDRAVSVELEPPG